MAFTTIESNYIFNITSNATYSQYSSFLAYTRTNEETRELCIILSNTLETADFWHYSVQDGFMITFNFETNKQEYIEIGQTNFTLDQENDIATNLYEYAYNPIAFLKFLDPKQIEMTPIFEVPQAHVEIDTSADLTQALKSYLSR